MSWNVAMLLVVLSVLFNAFCAGSETGFTSARRIRLLHRGKAGSRINALAARMLEKREEVIIGAVVGNNLAVVTGTSIATMAFVNRFGDHGETLAAVLMTALNIVFGEVLPKALYRAHTDRLTAASAPVLFPLLWMLMPLRWSALALARAILRLMGDSHDAEGEALDKGHILRIFKLSTRHKTLRKGEDVLLSRFVSSSRLSLETVMTPMEMVITLGENQAVAAAVDKVREGGHSRIPIRDGEGKIQGVVLFQDLLRADHNDPIADYLRPALFLDWKTNLEEAIRTLTAHHMSFSVVVDDSHDAVGIVTLEDLLEPLVGDIADEHDQPAASTARIPS